MVKVYDQTEDGEWYEAPSKQRIACCDCGLAHDYEFRIVEGRVQYRIRRNNRATAQIRRHLKRGGA